MPSAPPDPVTDPQLAISGCQATIGFVTDATLENGGAACWVDIRPDHLNRNNQLHGGIMSILLDAACGYAASRYFEGDSIAPVLTVSLNLQYIAPVANGRVTATGHVSGGGRKICYSNGELRDEAGGLIASAAGVFKKITKRPPT